MLGKLLEGLQTDDGSVQDHEHAHFMHMAIPRIGKESRFISFFFCFGAGCRFNFEIGVDAGDAELGGYVVGFPPEWRSPVVPNLRDWWFYARHELRKFIFYK